MASLAPRASSLALPRDSQAAGQANRVKTALNSSRPPRSIASATSAAVGRSALHHVDRGSVGLPSLRSSPRSFRCALRLLNNANTSSISWKRRPEVHAVAREAALELAARLAQDRAQLRRRFEELRGLAPDDLE